MAHGNRTGRPEFRPAPKFFLSGGRGAGKSTLVRRITASLGFPFGGFATEPVFAGERRVGFVIRDLVTGASSPVAELGEAGVLRAIRDGFERTGAEAIDRAVSMGRLVVMDELGFLESDAPLFQSAVFRALDSPLPVLGVLKEWPDPFLERVRAAGVALYTVTEPDRARVEAEILGSFRAAGFAGR